MSNGQQLTMPSLQGMSPSDAEQQLKGMGWNGQINEVSQPTGDSSMEDKVIGSSPSAGQKISRNQPITLYVGDYSSSPTTSTSPGGGGGGLFPPFTHNN